MQNAKIKVSTLLMLFVGFTSLQAQTVKDIDGNTYKTVTIGTQIWMAENLKTTKFNDGKPIPLVPDTSWHSLRTPGYCWYNNNKVTNSKSYGAMYNWFSVNSGKLCPAGWHVPSDEEWMTLVTFAGGEDTGGGKLKESGTVHWKSPNSEATNETGFTALPGGSRFDTDGAYYGMGDYGNWWTSTNFDSFSKGSAFIYMMDYRTVETSKGFPKNQSGASVRCILGSAESKTVPESQVTNVTIKGAPQNNINKQVADKSVPKGPVTFRNEAFRFEITPPEGWSFSKMVQQDPYEEFRTGRYSSSISTGEGDAVPENWNGFRLSSTGTTDGPQPALVIYAHKVADQKPEDFAILLERSLTNFGVKEKTFNREFSVGDATGFDCLYNLGVKVRYTALYKNGIRVTIQYFFPSNDPAQFDKYAPEIDMIIKSIRIK